VFFPLKALHCVFCTFRCDLLFGLQSFLFSSLVPLLGASPLLIHLFIVLFLVIHISISCCWVNFFPQATELCDVLKFLSYHKRTHMEISLYNYADKNSSKGVKQKWKLTNKDVSSISCSTFYSGSKDPCQILKHNWVHLPEHIFSSAVCRAFWKMEGRRLKVQIPFFLSQTSYLIQFQFYFTLVWWITWISLFYYINMIQGI